MPQNERGSHVENRNSDPQQGRRKFDKLLKSRAFWVVMYVLIAALLLGGIYMVAREYILFPSKYEAPPTPAPAEPPTPAPTLAPSATPAPTPEPTPYVKPIPLRIYFTAHKLQCDIYPVGVTEDNAMDTIDSAKDAAWYQYGPAPGEQGNALINGHVRWSGEKGTFSILKEMEVGEEVVIEFEDGTFKYFEAVSIDTYLLDEVPPEVMELDGESRMTLITCLGDYDTSIGTSRSRVVAVCKEKNAAAATAAPASTAAASQTASPALNAIADE